MRALEKRLRQSEKMAAIGQLAAGIAHEIRNPLAGISGSIELLRDGGSDEQQSQKLMSIVSKEIDRLNNLITEFLDFAKPEAPMEDHIDLGQLINEITQFISRDKLMSETLIESSIEAESMILGNRDKLKQALINIIVNGIQSMQDQESSKLTIDVKKNGKFIRVSIRDEGVGIAEDKRERIFEPFHTTKHKGTGLGLAITHSIIEAHKGQIEVLSEVGEGTEFVISFKALQTT
jgi:two-component system sensor histidine kinase PilS (NtrC family)